MFCDNKISSDVLCERLVYSELIKAIATLDTSGMYLCITFSFDFFEVSLTTYLIIIGYITHNGLRTLLCLFYQIVAKIKK